MEDTLYFSTPGDFPLDAFTTFGTNVKPKTDNPIGYFGTGLKYAVAIILRLGGHITLQTGGMEYEFYTYQKDFRSKTFNNVRMRSRKLWPLTKWRSRDLPFTTELGKNWEAWKAYRELASNTMDEQGLISENDPTNVSWLQVTCPEIVEAHRTATIFLPEDQEVLWDGARFRILKGRSQYIYYRGVRVFDLRHPSRVTYDFKKGEVELSEDRTAANIWLLFFRIKSVIQEVITDHELLKLLIKQEKEPTLEGEDFSYDYEPENSLTFRSVVRSFGGYGLSRSATTYHSLATAKGKPAEELSLTLTREEWREVASVLSQDDAYAPIREKILEMLDEEDETPQDVEDQELAELDLVNTGNESDEIPF